MNNTQKEIISLILEHYTHREQKIKTVEELTELSEIILQDYNKKEISTNKVLEEIADVEIMLEQLRRIYGLSRATISLKINQKLKRQLERINAETKKISTR